MAKLNSHNVTVSVRTNYLGDKWSETKQDLLDASTEQTDADLALVMATAKLVAAQKAQSAAIARKTLAEKRLASLRAKLSVELPTGEE